MVKGSFDVIDVKESAEYRDANTIQESLKSMVWSGGCANWNLDSAGRNTTNYHNETWKFWLSLYWPNWKDFELSGGTGAAMPWRPEWTLAAQGLTATTVLAAVVMSLKGRASFLHS